MTERVRVERRDSAAIVTLDIQKTRNALSLDVLELLGDALESLGADDTCQAIVLTGAHGHFCSGGDVSGMKAERTIPVSRMRMGIGHRVVRAIVHNSKPVIAAVEGYAAGAGLSLAAASDYVVSSTTAKYVSSFGKVGILPDLGLMWTLPQRIGLPEAKRMFVGMRTVEAAEALALGLSDCTAEAGQALQKAIELAQTYSLGAPLPVAIMKTLYARGCNSLDDALRAEVDVQPGLYLTADHREAVAAFLEKRAPVYQGR